MNENELALNLGYCEEAQTYCSVAEERYEQGRAVEREKTLSILREICEEVWDRDIPSATCPEYIEHHEDCLAIMALIDEKIKELKGTQE